MRTAVIDHPVNFQQEPELQQHMKDFLNSFLYRGERCPECGHPWTERGTLHYKSCSSHVTVHHPHKHH